jgi:hypothetical protein
LEIEMSRCLSYIGLVAAVFGLAFVTGGLSSSLARAESETTTPQISTPAIVILDEAPPADEVANEQAATAAAIKGANRSWGPEQAQGPPDTEGAGDSPTAWASLTADSQKEWLVCEYTEAVMPTALVVHANDAPGSLEKVSVFDEEGKEIEVWTGTDPTPRTAERGVSIIPIKTDFKVKKVKVYLDSPAVPGWNEIDAVGLRAKEEIQWAMNVTASSSYATGFEPTAVTVPINQLQSLEADVKQLKTEMEKLHTDMAELKDLIKSLKDDK